MKTKKPIKRIRTNVTLTPFLFQKVKDYDLNLSAFLQIKLAEYFAYIEGNQPYIQNVQPYTPETHGQQKQQTKKQHGKSTSSQERWACCDLNASRWLPKPQGYQATPQAQRIFAE